MTMIVLPFHSRVAVCIDLLIFSGKVKLISFNIYRVHNKCFLLSILSNCEHFI